MLRSSNSTPNKTDLITIFMLVYEKDINVKLII